MNKTSKKTSLRFHLSKKALQNMQFSLKLHAVSNVMKIFSMTQESHGTGSFNIAPCFIINLASSNMMLQLSQDYFPHMVI